MSKTAARGLALLSLAVTLVVALAVACSTTGSASTASSCGKKHRPTCTTPTPTPTPIAAVTTAAATTPSPTTTSTPTPSAATTTTSTTAPSPTAPTTTATSTPTAATTSTTTTTTTPTTSTCSSPVWTTSQEDYKGWDDPDAVGGLSNGVGVYGQYMVDNNMWNAGSYPVSQTLRACDFNSWSVTTTADNSTGDGAVKTYPNVHVDYIDWGTDQMQPLSDFSSLDMRFAHHAPSTAGIWNVAFDVWLNGVGNGSANELMIWTDNHQQSPAGTKVATVTLDGVEWDVWKGYSGHYLALVPTNGRVLTSGTLDLIPITQWLTANGHLPAASSLAQLDYGVEIVSTNGQPATFDFTDFKLTETPR